MMLHLETRPPAEMRYQTVGDWQTVNGVTVITVAAMPDRRYVFLVGLHELVEWFLCDLAGVPEADVDAFDQAWQEHDGYDEPGDDPAAPYYRQHQVASLVERTVAVALLVDWTAYGDAVDAAFAAAGVRA